VGKHLGSTGMSECPLAQSRHFIADECPLLGVKRTLIKSDLRLPAGQIRRMIICRQRGQSPGDSQRRRAASIASTSIRNPSSVNFPTNSFSKSVQTRRPTPWLIQKSVFSGNSATHLFVAETTILANERAQLRRDLQSANRVARSPAPIRSKPSAVPANDGLRPDNRNRAKDGGEPSQTENDRYC
jgi:hypothetical protein